MHNQKITPCLWVEKDAKAVAEYYFSIFKESKIDWKITSLTSQCPNYYAKLP